MFDSMLTVISNMTDVTLCNSSFNLTLQLEYRIDKSDRDDLPEPFRHLNHPLNYLPITIIIMPISISDLT